MGSVNLLSATIDIVQTNSAIGLFKEIRELFPKVNLKAVRPCGSVAAIECEDKRSALILRDGCLVLSNAIAKFWFDRAEVFYPKCIKPLQILANLSLIPSAKNNPNSQLPGRRNLLEASHPEILQFLYEMAIEGLVVVICALDADMNILYVNTQMSQRRGILTPAGMQKLNNPVLWRESMETYDRLLSDMDSDKDGYVPGFEFAHYRADDSFCKFSSTFYKCRDYSGVPVRIAVSAPGDFEVVRSASLIK